MRLPIALVLSLVVAGCGEVNPACTEAKTTIYGDADGDGWGNALDVQEVCGAPPLDAALEAGDCDDSDPSVFPGATEGCDGVDQDCNGVIDDGSDRVDRHADADGDGFGEPQLSSVCPNAGGFVDNAEDCDDGDPAVNPDATEVCNGWDDDCDTLVDDQDPDTDPATMTEWYQDADGDGYGLDGASTLRCDGGGVGVATGGDCDDLDPLVNPAAVEVCGGGDEDCDGLVDDADPSVDPATMQTFFADADGDGYGDALAQVDACSAGPGAAATGDDCDDSDPSVGPPSDWVLDGDGDGFGAGPVVGSGCTQPYPGTVQDLGGLDCDDADPDAFPGNPEICDDGIDQDCSGADQSCAATEFFLGNTNNSASLGPYFRGHVFQPTSPVTVDYFGHWMTLSGSCTIDYYVHSGPTDSGPWTVEWTGSANFGATTDYLISPPVGVVLQPGLFWGLGMGWNCTADYYWDSGGAWTGPWPFGLFSRTYWDNAYPGAGAAYAPPNVGGTSGSTAYESVFGYSP